MSEEHHTVYYELRDALAGSGCAICALALRSLARYFDALAYESVNDPGIRDALRASRGFCAAHGQLLREARTAAGAAILCRDVLAAASETLEQLARPEHGRGLERLFGRNERATSDPLAPQRACPACERRRAAEQIYLDTLVEHLTDDELLPALAGSAGLCLPHLRSALRRAPDEAVFARLRSAQLAIWGRLTAELDEFLRKQDHRFAREPVGAEGDAWARAVALVSSHPQLGRAHDE
jgi:hypothetical protein